jgi:competence protein ComEC
VTAVAVLGFVVLARPSASVLRAAVMALLALVGLATGRERPALVGLAGGVLLLVLADPALARQPGFVLSVLASAGLLLFAPGWQQLLERSMRPRFAAALAIPAAAQLACAPVIAAIGGGLSLIAIPANLLAEPAVAPATLLGVAAAVCGPVSPALAHLCAWAAVPPCWWLLTVAHQTSRVPAAAVGWPSGISGAVLMAVLTPPVVALARRAILRR